MKVTTIKKQEEMIPVILPVQEEKRDCLFFDEDLSLNKALGFVNIDNKFVVTNREDISDKIYKNITSLRTHAANGTFKGEDVQQSYYSIVNKQFIKNKITIEIQQLLNSVVESKITSFINSLLKDDKQISTSDIVFGTDGGYYGYNDVMMVESALSLRASLLNIMNTTNNALQKNILHIVYNIKASDLYEGCNILVNDKSNENINDFIFMMVSEKIVEAMNIFGDGLNLIIISRAPEINSDRELCEKIDVIRKENAPKRKIGQCHECEY